jgi:hypothetical protein
MTYPIFSKLLHCLFRYHNVNDDFFYCCGYGVSYPHDNVSFPTNSNEVKLKFYPYNDALPENDETATLTLTYPAIDDTGCGCGTGYLSPEYDYNITSPSSATVTIKDDDKWKIDLSGEDDAENSITLYEEGTTSTIHMREYLLIDICKFCLPSGKDLRRCQGTPKSNG